MPFPRGALWPQPDKPERKIHTPRIFRGQPSSVFSSNTWGLFSTHQVFVKHASISKPLLCYTLSVVRYLYQFTMGSKRSFPCSNRSSFRLSMGIEGSFWRMISDMTLPTAGENIKPCPLNPMA